MHWRLCIEKMNKTAGVIVSVEISSLGDLRASLHYNGQVSIKDPIGVLLHVHVPMQTVCLQRVVQSTWNIHYVSGVTTKSFKQEQMFYVSVVKTNKKAGLRLWMSSSRDWTGMFGVKGWFLSIRITMYPHDIASNSSAKTMVFILNWHQCRCSYS